MRTFFIIGFVLILLFAGPESPSINVSPRVVPEGGAVTIQCHVKPAEENRRVVLALEGFTSSERPIEGERGPVTTQLTFKHVPCDVEEASCTVFNAMGKSARVAQHIEVICGQH